MSMLAEITFTNKTDTLSIVREVVQSSWEAVCATMGPDGKYAVINHLNNPKVTKDGVSVAKALEFNEIRRNMIAKIITEPAIKTDNAVGDGTTTTVFMTYHLYQAFADKMTFKNIRFLDGLIEEIRKVIADEIIPANIEDPRFRDMLMTSSNYEDEIVDKILEIYRDYKNPNIRLIKADTLLADEIVFTKEIKFEGSFVMDEQVPPRGSFAIPEGSWPVVILDGPVRELTPAFISDITNLSIDAPVLLIARNFNPNVLDQIRSESQALGRQILVPYRIEAAGTLGTQVINDMGKLMGVVPLSDLKNFGTEHFEKPKASFALTKDGIYFSKANEYVQKAAETILETLDIRYGDMNILERQQVIGQELNRRIGRLRANNVTIRITGTVPSEATERYYRYEDVMKAAKTALEYGIIPGIGYGYLKGREYLDSLPQQSDEGLEQLVTCLKGVMVAQYEYLTGHTYVDPESVLFIDLVTGEESSTPMNIYDNAAATMTALSGAWSTAKTLGKISNVMGKSHTAY